MELNPLVDLAVNVSDLNKEFRNFSITFYRYGLQKADAEKQSSIAKAKVKEGRALAYKRIKSDPSVKHTEKSLESEIDTDGVVLDLQNKLIDAEHNAATIAAAVESMRAKKDMLMQMGADARKEK